MSSMELKFECARCGKELVVAPPPLFKYPVLTIAIMRCDCKDAEKTKEKSND